MNNFLKINQFSQQDIYLLLEKALQFKKATVFPQYPNHIVALLFYEKSTRTRVSFELAAKKLSMQVVQLDVNASSLGKGETIQDTLQTLTAMGIDLFAIRHPHTGFPMALAENFNSSPPCIINAGDGIGEHPSQALIDFMTIYTLKPNFKDLKVAIVGNIKHSRVANSLRSLCAILQIKELSLVAPPLWQPEKPQYGKITDSLEVGLAQADVVICLRVQQERLAAAEQIDLQDYAKNYQLTIDRLQYAKKEVMIMHPGPLNRGVEIDNAVADSEHSYILQQVTNGVYMRMAILEMLILNQIHSQAPSI